MRHAARTAVLVVGFVLMAAACSVSTVEDPALSAVSSTSPTSTVAARVDADSGTQPAESNDVESTEIPATDVPSERDQPTPESDDQGDATPSPTTSPPVSRSDLNPGPTPGSGNLQERSMFGPLECRAGEENIQLTELIYEAEFYDALVPMGRMWDSHVTPVDHLYFFLYEERERKMVRTPAAGRVIFIERSPRQQSPFWD